MYLDQKEIKNILSKPFKKYQKIASYQLLGGGINNLSDARYF